MGPSPGALRVALIASSRHPLREPFAGGLESLVWHLAAALRALGHQVTMFAAAGSDGVPLADELPRAVWAPSELAATDSSMPAREFMDDHHGHLKLMLRLAREGRDRFDVVHNHSLHHLPLAMAPTLGVPMITTLHTPPTPWLESAAAITGATGEEFVAVSEHVARSWTVLPTPPSVIGNGVDLAAWPAGPGGTEVVWSGRIVPEKAPHLAMAAARRAGLPIVLAGPLPDPAYFAAHVAPLLGPGARYAGHLDRPQLARLVGRSAAALVTPEWDEPFGLVVAEALACGTPVVAFDRGGIPEVMGGWSTGVLVPPGDVDAMATALRSAVHLDRRVVRRHAETSLSQERMVDAYVETYRRVASPVRQVVLPGSKNAVPASANALSQPSIGNQPQRV